MIEFVIAYDDNDNDLGDYFSQSYDYTTAAIHGVNGFDVYPIPGLECTVDIVNEKVSALENGKFIFAGYSHGSNDGKLLLTTNAHYVSEANAHLFCNSLFYTTACSVGRDLAKTLISSKCSCFVGYLDSSVATYDQFYPIYIACETFALNEFLTTGKTIQQAFDEMLDYFDTEIAKLYAASEILVAMELVQNKYCLTIIGNSQITSNDFHV